MLMSIAWLVHLERPAAQTNAAVELARTSFTSVHEYVAAEAIPRQLSPPSNLIMSEMFRPFVETMLRHSPTFRRQCMRIAAEPKLAIRMDLPWISSRSDVRARTFFRFKPDGGVLANIQIEPLQDYIELIAHEIEHVIEQLDGVNLAEHARRSRTGVMAVSNTTDVFETLRATRVGQRVRAEVGN